MVALAVMLIPLVTAEPAGAHAVNGYNYVYVYFSNDCVLSQGFTNHDYWDATTHSRAAYWHGGAYDPCGQYNYTGAYQLRIHPIHYKNGDGHGGYEWQIDWGTYYSACCYTSWTVYNTTPLSNSYGPGYYTQDNYSLAYVRQVADYRGGWAYAIWGDWLGY